jgi:hypothetical protein
MVRGLFPGPEQQPCSTSSPARKVIRNLLRKGWLSRLVGGRYMFLPPEHGPENLGENNVLALASAVVDPSYVGCWAAASFHGFTTQKPMSITVAVLRQVPARIVEGADIRFVTVAQRKFIGFARYDVYGRQVALSTPGSVQFRGGLPVFLVAADQAEKVVRLLATMVRRGLLPVLFPGRSDW